MLKRTLLAATAATLLATPALAGHCPADVKAIDNALAKMSLPSDVATKAKALRDEGDALHKAGDHGASTNKLAEAMRMILNAQ